jgi:hypothetical protein
MKNETFQACLANEWIKLDSKTRKILLKINSTILIFNIVSIIFITLFFIQNIQNHFVIKPIDNGINLDRFLSKMRRYRGDWVIT